MLNGPRAATRSRSVALGRPDPEWVRRPGEGPGRVGAGPTAPRPVAAPVIAALILVAAGVLLALVDPARGPVLCPFRAVTGLSCPGCGVTRALHALLTGRPGVALRDNALALALLPFAAWGAFVSLSHALGGARLKVLRLSPSATWVLGAVVVAWWVLRNLPFTPFTHLVPPA